MCVRVSKRGERRERGKAGVGWGGGGSNSLSLRGSSRDLRAKLCPNLSETTAMGEKASCQVC